MRTWIIIFLTLMLFGCGAPKTRVVLLEDAAGKTGKVLFTTAGGSQTLAQKGYGVGAVSASQAPSAPQPVTEEEIRTLYGRAIAAQPEAPLTFILNFITGSTTLTTESQRVLPQVVAAAAARPVARIAIAGHTDRTGDRAQNDLLSLARAEAVTASLRQAGIKPEAVVEVTSHGENNPLIPTGPNVAEPRNRRVEVIIY